MNKSRMRLRVYRAMSQLPVIFWLILVANLFTLAALGASSAGSGSLDACPDAHESVQSCGLVMPREPLGSGPGPAESLCANDGMHFPRCRSARECERRGNSGRCAGSISSVASSPFVWRRSR